MCLCFPSLLLLDDSRELGLQLQLSLGPVGAQAGLHFSLALHGPQHYCDIREVYGTYAPFYGEEWRPLLCVWSWSCQCVRGSRLGAESAPDERQPLSLARPGGVFTASEGSGPGGRHGTDAQALGVSEGRGPLPQPVAAGGQPSSGHTDLDSVWISPPRPPLRASLFAPWAKNVTWPLASLVHMEKDLQASDEDTRVQHKPLGLLKVRPALLAPHRPLAQRALPGQPHTRALGGTLPLTAPACVWTPGSESTWVPSSLTSSAALTLATSPLLHPWTPTHWDKLCFSWRF